MTTVAAPPVDSPAGQEPAGAGAGAGAGDRVARVLAVVVLVFSTGAFFANLPPLRLGESRSSVLLLWVLAYGVAAVVLLDGQLRLRRKVAPPPELVLFLVLASASVAWSVAPDITLRRAVGLVGTVLVGLLLAQRLTPLQILDAVRQAVLVIAVTSLLLLLSGSAAAIDDVHGSLRGVLATKNALGRVLALGLLATAATALLDPGRLRRCLLSAGLMCAALVLTDSGAGAVLAVLVVIGTVLVLLLRRRGGRLALGGAVALMLGATLLLAPSLTGEQVTGAIGEDTTLTGRDEVWSQSIEAAEQRPLLGYGYGAFWSSGGVEGERIRARLQWLVPHAHNGLLDATLDLGLLGAAAAVLVVGGLAVRGVLDLRHRDLPRATLRLAVAWLVVFSNLVESSLLQQNTLLTLLLVAALAARSSAPRAVPPPAHPPRIPVAGPA